MAFSAVRLSGTLYSDNGVTPVGAGTPIYGKVGNLSFVSTTTRAGGVWSLPITTSATGTTPVTIFVNGSSTLQATTFLMGLKASTSFSGIPLYKDTVTTMSTTSTGIVDMSKMTLYDFEDDTDVLYNAPLNSTTTIYGNFRIATGTTKAPSALLVKGSYTNNGTFTHNSGVLNVEGKPGSQQSSAVVTTVYNSNIDVTAQETEVRDVTFNTDGTKMYVIGQTGDDVNEYNLSKGFVVSTAVYSQVFSIAAKETAAQGVAFNTDGTKMFITGETSDAVHEYTLSTGFNVSTAVFSQSFSTAGQDTVSQDFSFNTDGTKMFMLGDTGNAVYEYTLSSGFDISTAVYSKNFSVATQDTSPYGLTFSADGTKMFMSGGVGHDINGYRLSTSFDVSTAVFYSNFSVNSADTANEGVAFNTDGTKMFVVGNAADVISEYHLEAPFDLAPAYVTNFSISAQDTTLRDIDFSSDGTKMYALGSLNKKVYQYSLATALDISTASYASASTSVNAYETAPTGLAFSATGSRMYIVGPNGDEVEQYNLSTPWSVSTAVHDVTFSIAAKSTTSQSIRLSADGKKMLVLDSDLFV